MQELGFTNIVMDPGVRLTYKLQDAVDAFKPDRVSQLCSLLIVAGDSS